jgi:hypothetical protein
MNSSSVVEPALQFLPPNLTPEQREEIRKCWDIIFGYIPGLRNTLDHPGSFSQRSEVSNSTEKEVSSIDKNATVLPAKRHLTRRKTSFCHLEHHVGTATNKFQQHLFGCARPIMYRKEAI